MKLTVSPPRDGHLPCHNNLSQQLLQLLQSCAQKMQLDVEVSPPANIVNTYCMQYHLLANLCMLWHFPHCKWPYKSTGFGKCHQIRICPPLDREKEMHMSLLGKLHKWAQKMTMIKGWICGVTAGIFFCLVSDQSTGHAILHNHCKVTQSYVCFRSYQLPSTW